MELSEGTVVAGRFRLLSRLGEGGMGVVWSAQHLVTRRSHALKFLKPCLSANPALRERFLREARAACALEHPHVIAIADVFDADDQMPVMVMELLDGEPLSQLLAREEALSVARTAALMLPVLEAVAAAHARGIVHRDLKPDNIFIARGEHGERPTVLDFGIAKLSAELVTDRSRADDVTGDGAFVGTPRYMAPEQLECRPASPAGDYWSIGVILYECLSGARPIEGDTFGEVIGRLLGGVLVPLSQVAPQLPRELADAVQRLLARAPADRPRSLERVASLLAEHGGAGKVGPFPPAAGLFTEHDGHASAVGESMVRTSRTAPLPGLALPSSVPAPAVARPGRSRYYAGASVAALIAALSYAVAGRTQPASRSASRTALAPSVRPAPEPPALLSQPAVDAAPDLLPARPLGHAASAPPPRVRRPRAPQPARASAPSPTPEIDENRLFSGRK